jgi:hypothetical protein
VEETRGEETPRLDRKNVYLKDTTHRTPVDPQRLVQCVVERNATVTELLSQCLLGLGLVEVGLRRTGVLPLLLRMRRGAV